MTATGRTCFISAPAGAPLEVLRAALASRGFRVLVPHELAVGTDWASEIQKQLAHADLVVGVLTAERQSPWVLFELGQASALGRRIVLIMPPAADPVPFALNQLLVLRIDLTNHEAIGFALDQVLSAPQWSTRHPTSSARSVPGLGDRVDLWIKRLDALVASQDWRGLENTVGEILRAAGTDVVSGTPSDAGADFAVWSDVLEPFVGNPLVVEVKARIRGGADAQAAARQLFEYLGASGARWGLLLYGAGPTAESDVWRTHVPPNVLVLSLRDLLEALRTRTFPEVVRDLRNRRVHGASS